MPATGNVSKDGGFDNRCTTMGGQQGNTGSTSVPSSKDVSLYLSVGQRVFIANEYLRHIRRHPSVPLTYFMPPLRDTNRVRSSIIEKRHGVKLCQCRREIKFLFVNCTSHFKKFRCGEAFVMMQQPIDYCRVIITMCQPKVSNNGPLLWVCAMKQISQGHTINLHT